MKAPGSSAPIRVLHLAAAESMLFPILRDQLRYLRDAGYEIHTASIDGPLAHRLRDEEGFPWTALPLTREVAPLRDWRALRFIERFCREQKFAIVHTHTPKGNVVGQWAARRAGVPIVLQTLHGFYFHDRMPWLKRRAWIALERFSARQSAHILCQNPEDIETAVRERIAPRERLTLLGNGIDLARFTPAGPDDPRRRRIRQELGLPQDALVVGMVARMVREKGFYEFVGAMEALHRARPQVYALIVGHPLASDRAGDRWQPDAAWWAAAQTRIGLRRVVNRDDMPDLYAAMDLHVLPSYREGFPRTLMEGAAMGLPQVATNIRGCRQTVEDGRTGFLVEPRDEAALRERIERLLSDPALRCQFGNAARSKALAEFDQRRVFEKVAACYQDLVTRFIS